MDRVIFASPLTLGFIADCCSAKVAKQFRDFKVKSLNSIPQAESSDLCVVENEKDMEKVLLSKALACIVPSRLKMKLPSDIIPLVTDDFRNVDCIKGFLV